MQNGDASHTIVGPQLAQGGFKLLCLRKIVTKRIEHGAFQAGGLPIRNGESGLRTGWVLLRGLIREARHWEGLPERLADALGEPTHALDLPGNGQRWREVSPTDIDGMVEALREQIARDGIPGPHRVLAISLGGMVALRWAQRFPDEVECLVLINSSLRGIAPFYQRLRPRQYPRLLLALLLPLSHEQRERLILRMTTRLQDDLPAVAQRHARWQQEAPVSKANLIRQLLAATRGFTPPQTLPGLPTLVLTSKSDQMVSWRCSKRIAERWGWPLELHSKAGHDLPLDAPEWVVERIRRWRDTELSCAQQPGGECHPHQADNCAGEGTQAKADPQSDE
ncbi:alpha/beta hydrolase [Halomonas sp. ANAO-440]|uniref:alpha/beta fold hydrolase n=1 Tax=Halomonas sp. ANAO-440 TaxID=2861360 RepID=UPI001CAA5425|nr:alpha/beta hydrolase [Halomonas sp. ANAO-440]MBZ0331167.1 alpha/beta hydrolase [Halomonas sp. ANAO-440]